MVCRLLFDLICNVVWRTGDCRSLNVEAGNGGEGLLVVEGWVRMYSC